MLLSPQYWTGAVAELDGLRFILGPVRGEVDIHEVLVQSVPPDPGPLLVSRGGREGRSG